ncbi:cysteine hydrolase family protein [Radicibacter daui]|uniref:cysteine hydrolase family protein n=1 Tax=Radicibacter daui TaxID=3064829 RepID=UPI004046B0D3
MSDRALILIDIQNDYFTGGRWELEGQEAAATRAGELLAAARAAGDLVIHVHHEFESTDAPFFVPGTDGARIHDSVAPRAGEITVLKHKANSFRGTNLKELLEKHGIHRVTLAGSMSHMCIDAGARAAADYGYEVTVVEDACATRTQEFLGVTVPGPQVHAVFMAALQFAYARVVNTSDYLAGLQAAA